MLHVQVNLGLPAELLTEIEANVKGKSRNAKLLACVKLGFEQLTKNTSCENVKPQKRRLRVVSP